MQRGRLARDLRWRVNSLMRPTGDRTRHDHRPCHSDLFWGFHRHLHDGAAEKGLRNVWMRGTRPIQLASRASLARRSLCASCRRVRTWRRRIPGPSPISTRAAIEAMPEGCIAVVDAMGVTDAGIFGDILCARMAKKGVAGLVTDGVVRDLAGVLGTGLPVWCQGAAAPPSVDGPDIRGLARAHRVRRRRGVS